MGQWSFFHSVPPLEAFIFPSGNLECPNSKLRHLVLCERSKGKGGVSFFPCRKVKGSSPITLLQNKAEKALALLLHSTQWNLPTTDASSFALKIQTVSPYQRDSRYCSNVSTKNLKEYKLICDNILFKFVTSSYFSAFSWSQVLPQSWIHQWG